MMSNGQAEETRYKMRMLCFIRDDEGVSAAGAVRVGRAEKRRRAEVWSKAAGVYEEGVDRGTRRRRDSRGGGRRGGRATRGRTCSTGPEGGGRRQAEGGLSHGQRAKG